jgi:hypothetical protein
MGYPLPLWAAAARYWPLLLAGWGIFKFVDYFRFKITGDSRSLFSGAEIAVLVLVILAGTGVTASSKVNPEIGRLFDFDEDFDFWDVTASTYAFTEHHERSAPPGSTIEIFNRYGSVDVRPADDDRILLDVEKKIRASSQAEADQYEQEFVFSIQNEGPRFRVISNKDSNGSDSRLAYERQRFKSNLIVQVPQRSAVKIENTQGTVRMRDLIGDQIITNSFALVSVRRITGSLLIENRNDGIDLSLDQPPQKDINLYGQYTDVRIELPSVSSFSIDAQAQSGVVESEFEELEISRSPGQQTIRGRVGGGPLIRIRTSNGSIQLNRGS